MRRFGDLRPVQRDKGAAEAAGQLAAEGFLPPAELVLARHGSLPAG